MDEEKKKKFFSPEIRQHAQLREQIYNALQGDICEYLFDKENGPYEQYMTERGLKLQPEVSEDLYKLCHEVQQKVGFKEKIEFYIANDSHINAHCLGSFDKNKPHLIWFTTPLVKVNSKVELKCIVGHEIGHLINRDRLLQALMHFVFPEGYLPLILERKYFLYKQLSELVCDRYGYIACGDLNTALMSHFKIVYGFNPEEMGITLDALLKQNDRDMEYLVRNTKAKDGLTHPSTPIRIKALQLYATAKSQEELDKRMDGIIDLLIKYGEEEVDLQINRFMAAAGLKIARADGKESKVETKEILKHISKRNLFPAGFLEEMREENLDDVIEDSVSKILELKPDFKNKMLAYVLDIILADGKIADEELKLIYEFAYIINIDKNTVKKILAKKIQEAFNPNFEAIC